MRTGLILRELATHTGGRFLGPARNAPELVDRVQSLTGTAVTSEFEIGKNGLRFPTRHLIEEGYYGAGGRERSGRFLRSRTTVVCRDSRFFTVAIEKGP